MNFKKSVFLVAAFLFYSGAVFAQSRISSINVNFFFSTENSVMVYADQEFELFADSQNCNSGDGSELAYLTLDHPKFDELYAMLLMAYASGKELHIWPSFTGDPAQDCRSRDSWFAGPVIHGVTLY